jgi:hypothetical protein
MHRVSNGRPWPAIRFPILNTRSELNDSSTNSNCNRLRAISGAELAHDAPKMDLDGLLGDTKLFSDLAVAFPVGDVAENLDFALTEVVVSQMFRESGGDFPGNTLTAGMNPPDRFEYLFRRHTFQHVTKSPYCECSPYLDVPLKCRQDDDSSVGKLRSDSNENFDSADVRELKIQERDIGLRSPVCVDALLARFNSGYERHIRLAINECTDALSK